MMPASLLLAVLLAPAPSASPTPAPAPLASPPAGPAPAPAPAEAELDLGPVGPWFARERNRFVLDPDAPAEDLTLTMAFLDFAVKGEEAAWARLQPRVEQAVTDPRPGSLPIVLAKFDIALAERYHAAGEALTQRPQAARDPAAEERIFLKALLLHPTKADYASHMSVAASLRKDWKAAERWAKLTIAIDPDFLSGWQELAYSYKNQERYREAIAVAQRGLNADGDMRTKALLLARQGQAHWMLGEKDQALSAFSGARRLGGPPWIDSYLEGKQELGKPFREPGVAGAAASPAGAASPAPTSAPAPGKKK